MDWKWKEVPPPTDPPYAKRLSQITDLNPMFCKEEIETTESALAAPVEAGTLANLGFKLHESGLCSV